MHLDECFQLAFTRPITNTIDDDEHAVNNTNPATAVNDLSFSATTDNNPPPPPPQTIELTQEGSIISAVKCIASDWGTKSQTNFYIPDEYYPGYSYLFEDEGKISCSSNNNNNGHSSQHFTARIRPRRPAFVHAEELNNLHPHHHYTSAPCSTTYDNNSIGNHNNMLNINMAWTAEHSTTTHSILSVTSRGLSMQQDAQYHQPSHVAPLSSSSSSMLPSPQNANYCNTIMHPPSPPMTIPYIHPHLELPVPPLHLPWYFGALCWSFALAGAVMLYIPAKWARFGGGRVVVVLNSNGGGKRVEYKRHWFPFRGFAMALLICMGPCSFLADYIHMTHISQWHTIDRFLACILMSLELVKLFAMRLYTRPPMYLLYLVNCAVAAGCFLQSQKSQGIMDTEGFVFWHCGWHCYPIVQVVVYCVEHFMNGQWGEYYAFGGEIENGMGQCRRGERGGILLSTIVMMKYWKYDGKGA